MNTENLPIYLADHSAMMTLELELVGRSLKSNQTSSDDFVRDFGEFLPKLADDIKNQQAVISSLLDEVGSGTNPIKELGAWLFEKVGGIKADARFPGYEDLNRLNALERLILGAKSRSAMWTALTAGEHGQQLNATQHRDKTEQHLNQLRELHETAAAKAFGSDSEDCSTPSGCCGSQSTKLSANPSTSTAGD
ncbi:MAG: hypothetical protein HKN47_05945 [Pirellulaceae bacterium]|nr:hypothetical protein [Pirellulaceae bacterium]